MKFKIAFVLLILFGVNSLSAKPILINGIYYNLYSYEPYTAEVTSNDKYEYKGAVVIPSKVYFDRHYYSVTSIGYEAFRNCDGLTSITIPNSVTEIGWSAFENCVGLTSITIPNSVTEIGWSAFWACSSLTSVTIPNSVTTIEGSAFYGCDNLKKTNYTGTIADWCKIKFGSYNANPIYSSHNLFINGIEVKDLVIPNSVISIGDYTFYYCKGLTSITIPNSVTSIGDYAFDGCSGLTSITIPNSVTLIGSSAFSGCSGLTSLSVSKDNPNYDSRENCNAIIETKSNKLIAGCKNTIIPNSVTSIGDYAFYNCDGLTSITIPNFVTSIGDMAFSFCDGLTSITIPNSVISIGKSAFSSCSKLLSITIPNSVTTIGDKTFSRCRKLSSITIPNSVTSIGERAFYYCDGLTSITIPNSVTSIGDYAFAWCTGLTSITIPNSVTEIGDWAFWNCDGLTSITIPNSVTSIGKSAFSWCSKLTSITIPNSVTSIGKDAFEYCDQLTDLYVPRHLDISKIGIDKKKTKIHYLPKVTPNLSIIADSIQLIGTRQSSTLGAEENATLRIPIVNTGKGNANDIVVSLSVKGATDGVQFHDTTHVGTIISNNRRTITIPISTTPWTTTGSLQLTITAKTMGSTATANYTISTSALVPPLVEISGWQFSSSDDVLQKKQPFKLQYTIRNSGQGRAKGVRVILPNTSSLTLLDGSATQNCALLSSAEEQTYMCEYVSSAQTSDSISLMINLTESYGKYAKNAVIPIVFGKTPCVNTVRHASIEEVHIDAIGVAKRFQQVSGTTISLTHSDWQRKYYRANASEGKKMPYAMFKVKFTGNSESIRWGKELVRMDLGNIYVVKDLERNIDNELWFLIPVEAQYIDLTCGDGCQPISIWQGKLTPNGVYEGEIECKLSK